MGISSKIAIITIAICTVSFPRAAGALEVSGDRLDNSSQAGIELQQWDPTPKDSGQCSGKKCATGGSY